MSFNKQEITKQYFYLLHNKGKFVIPPYTYSYIMANDSIQVEKKKNRIGFVLFPYKHFLLPAYDKEIQNFYNFECIYSFPTTLEKEKGTLLNMQFLLQRDYSLLNYRRYGTDINGKGRPVLYNQSELNWYLNNKRVLKQNICLFIKNVGQHFFLYEVDDLKVIIVWDDYYTNTINIITMTQVIRTSLAHMNFDYPYTVWSVYINALCSFFSMFPCGTVFNTTLEFLRGVTSILYVPLHPLTCFEIRTKIKEEINNDIRVFDKFDKKQWLNNDKNKMVKDVYHLDYNKKEKKT